jgi:hypothetical protein
MASVDLSNYNAVGTTLFVDILIPGAELYLSDSDFAWSVGGRSYQNLGSLLSVGKSHSNLRATPHQLSIEMSGIDAQVFSAAFNSDVQGSSVRVSRFWTEPGSPTVIGSLTQKFEGIVNNVSFKETWNPPNSEFTIAFQCVSTLQLLRNRIAGRRTNEDDMQKYFPTDTSFKRVARIKNSNFNFGSPNKAPKYGTTY